MRAQLDPVDHDVDTSADVDERLAELLAAAAGPVNWRDIDPADTKSEWERLRAWIDWFRPEFGYDHRIVPPCWYLHTALLEVLSALHDMWRACYGPTAEPGDAAAFQRTLIVLEDRLRELAARTGCNPGTHRPDVLVDYPDDRNQWAAHIAREVDRRTAGHGGEPDANAGQSTRSTPRSGEFR